MGTLGRKPALAPLRVDDIPDGAGSGLDADLLDGQQGNSFVLVSEKAAVNGVATLDSAGKIPAGQLPAISISSVNVVADNTERDGLTVQTGDLAKVTSTGLTFVFDGSAWVEIVAAYPVDSVNGQTGVVTLTTDDVGEGSTNKYYSSTLANADIDTRVDKTFVDALNVDADTVDGAGLNDAGSGALDLWSAQKISSEAVSASVGGTFLGDVTVPNLKVSDGGTIGSVSDADAITVAAGGEATFSQLITASSGINFGSDTLDDYEEGTFAAQLIPADGSITLNSGFDTLSYRKVGDVVHIFGHIIISSTTAALNTRLIMPFSSANFIDSAARSYHPVIVLSGTENVNRYAIEMNEGTVDFFMKYISGSSSLNVNSTRLPAGSELFFNFSYIAV